VGNRVKRTERIEEVRRQGSKDGREEGEVAQRGRGGGAEGAEKRGRAKAQA
jgi:hypothetical protein